MTHLLVTNDFPPQVGGIQRYLWDLWSRLGADEVVVLTPDQPGAAAFDTASPIPVRRLAHRALLPTPGMAATIDRVADEVGADLVVLDPAFPLGALGPHLRHPYAVVVHGAEVTVWAAVPFAQLAQRRTLRDAVGVIAAGGFPARAAVRAAAAHLAVHIVDPPVDTGRFVPIADDARSAARARFGLDPGGDLVLGVSRLVPRKGFDTLIAAVGRLARDRPHLELALAGDGRDLARLEGLATRHDAPVHFLGRVDDEDLPALMASADVFAMCCRDRWGGLEQEGFGMVFAEAAACGVPSVAGRSGGSDEAVLHGVTGWVVDDPTDAEWVADAVAHLLDHPDDRARMGHAARTRVVAEFDADRQAARLRGALGLLRSAVVDADEPAP